MLATPLVVVAAAPSYWWFRLALVFALGPIPLVLYVTRVTDDFIYSEQWDAFVREPWYLLALMVTPLPLVIYGMIRYRADR